MLDMDSSSLVMTVRYRIAEDQQHVIAKNYAAAVFKSHRVANGSREVAASVPTALLPNFLSLIQELGGNVLSDLQP
jgi:hypothetical protein